jgi:hypothetical protein
MQNLNVRLRPCNSARCRKLQSIRKAKLVASIGPAEKERSEPSEQSERGGHVLISESIDTASGLAESTVPDEDIPADSDTIIDPDDKTAAANKQRVRLKNERKIERAQRSASLEQPIVAVPIGPPSAPYGHDENGNAIRPPKMGHTMAPQIDVVPAPEQTPVSLYSPAPEVPRPDSSQSLWNRPVIGDIDGAGRWKRKRDELRPGEKSIPVSASSGGDLVKQIKLRAIKPFGLEVPRLRRSSGLHAPREYSLRKIFQPYGVTRGKIVEWLSDLNILHVNEPIEERVCRKQLVTQEADNTEFEKQCTGKISGLQAKIADTEKEIADLRERWKINGNTNRQNIALKKRLLKAIEKVQREITQTKRAKPPKSEPKQIEIDIPNTEYIRLRFVGQTLDETWVSDYLKSYDAHGFPLNPLVSDETFRVFENAVIYQALNKKVLVVDSDVLAILTRKYPGLLNPGQEQALSDRQDDFYAEYDAHASGLRFRGKGIKVTGNKYHGKALEDFDGVFRTHRGPGGSSGDTHPGAPDFDPSDDTND